MSDKKIAFIYSHGGPVFDEKSHDGLNERGRNIVKSIKSAIDSGADMVFVSESILHGAEPQIKTLMKKGLFRGYENKMDVSEYSIASEVPFPKNYLFNRAAQRATGFFGLVFSDSDVLYSYGFAQKALHILDTFEFAQPDNVVYLDADGHPERSEPMAMKMFNTNPENRNSITYVQGMPGMVNIARRDSFLSIGGFSQAISGVNYEDMEYTFRLKMLGKSMGYIANEQCYHAFHSRKATARKKEGLPNMHAENLNFMCWWVSHMRIPIPGNTFDRERFGQYLTVIKHSLEANKHLHGPYTNRTGTITPEYDSNQRYRSYLFGLAEPYSDIEPKDVQCAAIIDAALFWRISPEEVLTINKDWYHRPYVIDSNDIHAFERKSQEGANEEQRRAEEEARKREEDERRAEEQRRAEEARKKEEERRHAEEQHRAEEARKREEEQRRASEEMKKRLKDAIRQVSDEDREKSHDLSVKMKAILRKKARSDL